MKKPEETSAPDFSEYMWMAEDGADEGLQKQVEEEMILIEQDFLEAMFDDLLREEEENETYYGPPDQMPPVQAVSSFANGVAISNSASNCTMQLPTIESQLNPHAPEFVPSFLSNPVVGASS